MIRLTCWACALTLLMCSVGSAQEAPAPSPPKKLMIGLPESVFQGVARPFVQVAASPFTKLVKEKVGLSAEIVFFKDGDKAAEALAKGEIHICVFMGHEMAWAKAEHGRKLDVVAVVDPVTDATPIVALVSATSNYKSLGDLEGKTLVMPKFVTDQVSLFVHKPMANTAKPVAYGEITKADTVVEAIYEVKEGTADVTFIDGLSLEYFKREHPGAFKRLRILERSPHFPQACIAVKKDALPAKMEADLKNALLSATSDKQGAKMLEMWKLKSLVAPTADYEAELIAQNAAFPAKARKGAPGTIVSQEKPMSKD